MTIHKLYEDVDECLMCRDRAKQLNNTLTIMPEHITENIMMFAGCKRCETDLDMIKLMDEIEALKNKRGARELRMQLEKKGHRLADDMEKIMEDDYLSS